MIIHLGGDPISVVHAEIGQTFHSEQDCIKRMQTIFKEADEDKNPIPIMEGINFCQGMAPGTDKHIPTNAVNTNNATTLGFVIS